MTLKNDVIFEKMDYKSLQLRHQLKSSFSMKFLRTPTYMPNVTFCLGGN